MSADLTHTTSSRGVEVESPNLDGALCIPPNGPFKRALRLPPHDIQSNRLPPLNQSSKRLSTTPGMPRR